ncbi:MAG: hypothetical protein WCF78_03970 [archaeon]
MLGKQLKLNLKPKKYKDPNQLELGFKIRDSNLKKLPQAKLLKPKISEIKSIYKKAIPVSELKIKKAYFSEIGAFGIRHISDGIDRNQAQRKGLLNTLKFIEMRLGKNLKFKSLEQKIIFNFFQKLAEDNQKTINMLNRLKAMREYVVITGPGIIKRSSRNDPQLVMDVREEIDKFEIEIPLLKEEIIKHETNYLARYDLYKNEKIFDEMISQFY